MSSTRTLVVFSQDLPTFLLEDLSRYDILVARAVHREYAEKSGLDFKDITECIEPGSIYDASAFAEELSLQVLPDGTPVTKTVLYKGYELWWMHYNSLFFYFCIPFIQNRKLLEFLKKQDSIDLYEPPSKILFTSYLESYNRKVRVIENRALKDYSYVPFGIVLQIFLTLVSLPVLFLQRKHLLVFTGDKFDTGKDYDFRMKLIYQELRQKSVPFVEGIRSLESWRKVLEHAWKRKRPVIYSEAITFIARFLSIVGGGRRRAHARFDTKNFSQETDPSVRFKLAVATQYSKNLSEDIWAIRIWRLILGGIGIRAAFFSAAMERNYHTVMATKLRGIPTVGILHGAASRHYNVYDFLPAFDGNKSLSVDVYGVWSTWWKEYYEKNSRVYKPEQLVVSGPMRPFRSKIPQTLERKNGTNEQIRVLLVSEIIAVPEEIIPYIDRILADNRFSLRIKFRAYRDVFEQWLKKERPDIVESIGEKGVLKGSIEEGIMVSDVVIGSHSTGVLEALLYKKPFVFFETKKWGDYFDLTASIETSAFFATSPKDLIHKILLNNSMDLETVQRLRFQYFGDPKQNGSKWVVDRLIQLLKS